MKNRLKKAFKLIILIFGLSLLSLTNCEYDDHINLENESIEQKSNVSVISYDELIQDNQIKEIITNLNSNSQTDVHAKDYNSVGGSTCENMDISPDKTALLETGDGFTKVIIPVDLIKPKSGKTNKTNSNKTLENASALNLIIEQKSNIISDAYILKYYLTDRNTIIIEAFDLNGTALNYNSTLNSTQKSNKSCNTSISYEITYTGGGNCCGNGITTLTPTGVTVTSITSSCSSSGGEVQDYAPTKPTLCSSSPGSSSGGSNHSIQINYDSNNIPENICVNADCSITVKNIIPEQILFHNNDLEDVAPFFHYPIGSNYANKYKELTILLKEYIPLLRNNARLIKTISNLTGLSNEKIKQDFTWGKGPEVHIEQLGKGTKGENIHGKFNPLEPNKIILDIDLVITLEELAMVENPTQEQIKQLQLFDGLITFAVCLHEYVHFADNAFDGVMKDSEDLELGLLFEELFIGGYYEIDPNGKVILIPAN